MPDTMRTVRFHAIGEPGEVLHLESGPLPEPGPDRVRIAVHACGLNPADWALCRGLFPGRLPRGVGCDVSGTVEAIGDGVDDVAIGEMVFGTADWAQCPSAGAADRAIMDHWFAVPEGLDPTVAGACAMVLGTADIHLRALGVGAGQTILIHGAGGMVGYVGVQLALARGARVIATAGQTFASALRDRGAEVTAYGDGMGQRILELAGGPVDLVLDTAPVGGALPQLVQVAGGDPARVLTISDFQAAAQLGVRDSFHEDLASIDRYAAFDAFAQGAAEGRFSLPIARTFPLQDWRAALELSLSGRPHGKLVLLPAA